MDLRPKFGIAASSGIALRREVTDGLDADALQAVVRADAELELLDGEVLHPVRGRDLGGLTRCRLAEALDLLEVGEDGELPDEDLGGLADRILRCDRAVGRDVEDELVVVGALTDARVVDLVRDTAYGGEDRVDRDHADRRLGPTVELGRDVAATAPDRERDLELRLVGEVRELEVGSEDLEICRRLDVCGGDDAGALA